MHFARMDTIPIVPHGRPAARAWLVLAILCGVYALNFLDRQLLSILAKPIQDSLHITDGQLGRIGGIYIALFYCLLAIPVGWLADRTSRARVLSIACALWSAATIAVDYPPATVSSLPREWRWGWARPAACRLPTPSSPTTSRAANAARRSVCSISGRRSVRRSALRWARPSRCPMAGAVLSSCWAQPVSQLRSRLHCLCASRHAAALIPRRFRAPQQPRISPPHSPCFSPARFCCCLRWRAGPRRSSPTVPETSRRSF